MKIYEHIIHYTTVSWRLYNRLLNPPEHPVYWRTLNAHTAYRVPKPFLLLLWSLVVAACLIVWWYLAQFAMPLPITFAIVLTIFTTTYVSLWTIDISLTIASERQQSTYDPLCMTPTGAFGANWGWVTGILHRYDRFAWLDMGRKFFTLFNLIILCMVLLTIILRGVDDVGNQHIILILEITLLAMLTYADHVQGSVIGVLTALLVPHYIRNAVDVHVWTVFIYITLQVLNLTIVIVAYLLIMVYSNGQSLFLLCLLYVLREFLLAGLWLLVSRQLNTD